MEPLNIVLRRRADDRQVESLRNVAALNKLGSIASFAASSDSKVKTALVSRKIVEQNGRLRDRLDERRRRLAELLTAERTMFEAEFMSSFESPEVVKERYVRDSARGNADGGSSKGLSQPC